MNVEMYSTEQYLVVSSATTPGTRTQERDGLVNKVAQPLEDVEQVAEDGQRRREGHSLLKIHNHSVSLVSPDFYRHVVYLGRCCAEKKRSIRITIKSQQ
jgi:hypothetical protein